MSANNEQFQEQDQDSSAAQDLGAALNEGSDPGFVVSSDARKRKLSPGTMAVGGVLLCCAAVTYFMYLKNGPKAASAATPGTAQASTTINEFLSSDTENVARMKSMLQDTEKAVQQMQSQPAKTQVPLDDLKTNPFRQVTTKVSEHAEEDAAKKRRDEMLKSVGTLHVQSIMSGTRKAAMINGKMYQEGQQVDRFTVERIQPGSVIVRCEKSRFELKMQK